MKDREFKANGDLAIRPDAVGLVWPRAPQDWDKQGTVAVIPINGPLEHRGGWWFDSYESILSRFEGAMLDEEVTAIVLKIDSPGGEVSGLNEAVKRMRAMQKEHGKKVVAYADDEAYSAAYALATVASEIYLPEGGGLGSVGVLATVCDRTEATKEAGLRIEVIRSGERKAEGHPDIPLTDAAIGRVQARVDELAQQFFSLVAEARPTNPKKLNALQGSCVYGQNAVDAGLADGVLSFDEVMAGFGESTADEVVFNSERDTNEDMSFAALQKKVDAAIAVVMAAKNPADRKVAALALSKAQMALTEAKVKKTYEKKTTETETEEDDGEPVDDEDEESEESEEAETSDDDEEPKEKKSKASSLASFVKSLTGQSSSLAAQQVLASMHEQAQQNAANAAEIAKLKADAVKAKVDSLVAEGVTAGKIKPAQLAWAKTLSLKDLKAYLAATPALFNARQPAVQQVTEESEETGSNGLTETETKLCQMTGVSVEDYKARKASGVQLPKVN